jgi:hypothetical protein
MLVPALIVVGVLVLIVLLGIGFLLWSLSTQETAEEAGRAADFRGRLRQAERRAAVYRFPVVYMTWEHYSQLPRLANLPKGFEQKCSLGFWFAFGSSEKTEDTIVIGQIVATGDLNANQWCTIALPERGWNKYRLVIVPAQQHEKASAHA